MFSFTYDCSFYRHNAFLIDRSFSALIGTVFSLTQKSVFASFRMWQFAGFMLMFLVSPHVCMDVKIYIALGICAVAMVLYVAMEFAKRKMVTPAWYDLYERIE